MSKEKRNNIIAIFSATLLIIAALFIVSILRNNAFNNEVHQKLYSGDVLFSELEGEPGEDIPLIARMICVADSFDAMNSNRVYRKRLTKEAILDEIETNKGTQFDPKIADILLKLIKSGRIEME